MFGDRFVECFTALDSGGDITNDIAKIALPLGIALLIKRGHGLDERDTGLDHGGELPGNKNGIGFFDRPSFFAGLADVGLFLERKDHESTAHQAGHGVVLVDSVLDAGDNAAGSIAGLVSESNHIVETMVSIST